MSNFFSKLFGGGWKDPTKDARNRINQIPDQMRPYYEPYIQAGQRQIPGLEEQYGQLIHDPGEMLNNIGGSYQQSPGFQYALQQALGGANRAAAAGGMAGGLSNQQQNMEIATQLANQDYGNWLNQALGLYGRGLGGSENLMQTGYGAGNEFAQSLGNMGLQDALLRQLSQNAKNKHRGGMLGGILGSLGSIGGAMYGGPFGATIGGNVGQQFGNIFGG